MNAHDIGDTLAGSGRRGLVVGRNQRAALRAYRCLQNGRSLNGRVMARCNSDFGFLLNATDCFWRDLYGNIECS